MLKKPENPSHTGNAAKRSVVAHVSYLLLSLQQGITPKKAASKAQKEYDGLVEKIDGCIYCGRSREQIIQEMEENGEKEGNGISALEKEHIIDFRNNSLSIDHPNNWVPTCRYCNQEKNQFRSWKEFVIQSNRVPNLRKNKIFEIFEKQLLGFSDFEPIMEQIVVEIDNFKQSINKQVVAKQKEIELRVIALFRESLMKNDLLKK